MTSRDRRHAFSNAVRTQGDRLFCDAVFWRSPDDPILLIDALRLLVNSYRVNMN
jgi:hypothetical protein